MTDVLVEEVGTYICCLADETGSTFGPVARRIKGMPNSWGCY